MLREIEKTYSCQLPDDYRTFMLQNNGGFPTPDCVTFNEAGRETASDVFCFFAIGDERTWASLEWHQESFSERLPAGTLPVARDSSGNLWLLETIGKTKGAMVFWDHGSYDTFDETDIDNLPRVAANFDDFLKALGTYCSEIEDDMVPSRYALVIQAIDGMAKNNPGFGTRDNPEFVWHCDIDANGNCKMQFIQYEVHAMVPHTDGYSVLRANNGLIEQGPTRLPE